MSVRQYIGARYVPRFLGTWNNTTQYEALDVVDNGSGTSYIARKNVPAGTPLTNTEFWFIYGASSGAIINLQSRMDAAENDIANINIAIGDINGDITAIEEDLKALSDDVIVIGDSYAVDSSAGGKSWASYVSEVYPDAYKAVIGGTGFGSDVYITDNFLTMLQGVSVADPKTITSIIILGGANDANLLADGRLTESTLRARIDSFCDYVATTYPNAKVKLSFVGGYRTSARMNVYYRCANIYRSQAYNHTNAEYFSNGECIMHNNAFINSTDLVHPTAEASKLLGQLALSMISGGVFDFVWDQDVTATAVSGTTLYNIGAFKSAYRNNMAEVTFTGTNANNTYISIVYDTEFDMSVGTALSLINLSGVPVGGATPALVYTPVVIGATGIATVNASMYLSIQNNQLVAKYIGGDTIRVKNILIPLTTIRMLLGLN